ncbi:phage tail protein [Thioclava sp.]|uniref:phage tail protein n=1 Tax=Thioclava sp. TaxID=1933450 RepID=UPI0032420A75
MPQAAAGALALGGAAVAAGGVGAALAATGFIGIAANFGASLLLSAASAALAPKPDFGIKSRDVTVREPASPRKMAYGKVRTGGTIVFLETSGEKRLSDQNQDGWVNGPWDLTELKEWLDKLLGPVQDAFGGGDATEETFENPGKRMLHMVIVLAGHEVEAIDEVYFDGVLAFNADGTQAPDKHGKPKFTGNHVYAQIEKRLGAPDQEAFTLVRDYLPYKWTADHKLSGCAALCVSLYFDPKIFANGMPNVTANVRGKNNILDPRTGTRGYTDNAALCLADYLADSTYGLGAEIDDPRGTNEDELIAAANACDEVVATVDDATETRYALNGIVDTSQTPQTVIRAMLTSMAGHAVRRSGQWYVLPGVYRPPSMILTDGQATGSLKLVTRLSRSDNFNSVRGTFVSPENDWQVDDFPAYESAAYLAEDRGRKSWQDIELPFTISASMAQRIAKIELEQARRQMSIEWPGNLSVMQVGCGDVVSVTRDRWGFEGKPFIVTGFTFEKADNGLIPSLRLAETSPLVYDWDTTEVQIYAAAPRTSLDDPFDIFPPGITEVTESLYATRQNAVKARTTVTWSESLSGSVDRYELEGSLDGGDYELLAITPNLTASIDDITPGNWKFRVRAVTILGADSDWSSVVTKKITGLGAEPAALVDATLQAAGGLAILKWDLHAELAVRIGGHIVIRHSSNAVPSWSNSVSVDEVSGAQTVAVVPLVPGAYIVRARDSSGILGPATTLFASGAQAVPFTAVGMLQEDDTFTGAKEGCGIVSGGLQLSSGDLISSFASIAALPSIAYPTGTVAGQATYDFATNFDLGTVRTVRLRREIDMAVISLTDSIAGRLGNVSTWSSISGTGGADADAWVEVALTDDDPAGTPVWGDWRLVENDEVTARGIKARAKMKTLDPKYTPRISVLRLHADEVA